MEILADGGNDEVLRATPSHRFWVEGQGWTVAAELHAGDVLSLRSGKHAVFERAEVERELATVYNLEVEEDHSYFVGDEGVWVHNGCGPAKPFTPEQQDLVAMAKADKAAGGVSAADMQAYIDLNNEAGPNGFTAADAVRGPETHAPRSPNSTPGPGQLPHGHVGPVGHIPVK